MFPCASRLWSLRHRRREDKDHTIQAMKDEMARAKSRLELAIPPSNQPVRPYYIEYRLLDLDIREITGEFGALLSTGHSRTRQMTVSARVGDYKLDSSNFIGDEGFRGFIGLPGASASTAITTRFGRICGLPPIRRSRKRLKLIPANRLI